MDEILQERFGIVTLCTLSCSLSQNAPMTDCASPPRKRKLSAAESKSVPYLDEDALSSSCRDCGGGGSVVRSTSGFFVCSSCGLVHDPVFRFEKYTTKMETTNPHTETETRIERLQDMVIKLKRQESGKTWAGDLKEETQKKFGHMCQKIETAASHCTSLLGWSEPEKHRVVRESVRIYTEIYSRLCARKGDTQKRIINSSVSACAVFVAVCKHLGVELLENAACQFFSDGHTLLSMQERVRRKAKEIYARLRGKTTKSTTPDSVKSPVVAGIESIRPAARQLPAGIPLLIEKKARVFASSLAVSSELKETLVVNMLKSETFPQFEACMPSMDPKVLEKHYLTVSALLAYHAVKKVRAQQSHAVRKFKRRRTRKHGSLKRDSNDVRLKDLKLLHQKVTPSCLNKISKIMKGLGFVF